MAKEQPNRIAELRKAAGLTQAELADKLDVHWVTVSKLERGKIQLHTGWMEAIAQALGTNPISLISETPETIEIVINGALGEDGRYASFSDEYNDAEEIEVDLPIHPIGSELGFWVVIEGDRYWPFFHDQDKLFFTPVLEEEAPAYVGRFVIARTRAGDELAGYMSSATTEPRCDLQQVNGKTLQNLLIDDLAVLTQVRYAWPTETLTHPAPGGRFEKDSRFSLAPLTRP